MANKLSRIAFRFIISVFAITLLADVIANEKPLIAKLNGEVYFPAFKPDESQSLQPVSWETARYDWVLFAPIPYSPGNFDFSNAQSKGPFDAQDVKSIRWRHWLGTDELGRDILAGLIHGSRIALAVGLISMFIALILGLLLGSVAGYYGDQKIKILRINLLILLLLLPISLFWAFSSRWHILLESLNNSLSKFSFELLISLSIIGACILLANTGSLFLKKSNFWTRQINFPADMIISRFIEIINSVPTLFLLISLIAITQPSISLVILIIGVTSWTGIAKLIRAELLRIKNLEYIEAAESLGFSNIRILIKHAIPNALSPVLVATAFGIASAILAESTLSFIGIGLPPETVTWGSLLSSARQSPSAWWLAVFPGIMIFATVTFFNYAGQSLSDALDPKLRIEK